MTNTTVAALDAKAEEYVQLLAESDKLSEQTKELNKKIGAFEQDIVKILEDLDRKDYDSPVGKFTIDQKWSVKMPTDGVNREKFFNWAKEKGVYGDIISVHAKLVNALWKRERELAVENGTLMEFEIPGIEAPNLFKDIKFKKKK